LIAVVVKKFCCFFVQRHHSNRMQWQVCARLLLGNEYWQGTKEIHG